MIAVWMTADAALFFFVSGVSMFFFVTFLFELSILYASFVLFCFYKLS